MSISSTSSTHASSLSKDVYLAVSPGRQEGLFAARALDRGERILCEGPLFTVNSPSSLPIALSVVAPDKQDIFLSLSNAYADNPSLSRQEGIFHTNAFSLSDDTRLSSSFSAGSSTPRYGIFPLTARLNHACRPNVKSSYHPSSNTMQVHVLRPIAPHEELFTSYLGRSDLYGATTAQRKARLQKSWAFDCSCSLCEANPTVLSASDARRSDLSALHSRLPGLRPSDAGQTLRDCASALTLLEEEGLFLDGDEFASAAARACAWHQDWEAARAWARVGWESARSEYGGESELARRLEEGWKNAKGLLPSGVKGEKKELMGLTREVLGSRLPPSDSASSAGLSGMFGKMKRQLLFS
ncbi:hypothetical protein JCM6882_001400 [Rhodosporidiobolus microsporus]